jgi:hypothetical protein
VDLLATASVMVRIPVMPKHLSNEQLFETGLPEDRSGLRFFTPPQFCCVQKLTVGDYVHLDHDYAAELNLIPNGQPISCLKRLKSTWRAGDELKTRLWKSAWWANLSTPTSLMGDRIGYWLPISAVRILSERKSGISCTVDRLGLAIVSGIATQARYGNVGAVDDASRKH